MNNDLSSYFEDPEFKDLLAKYEGMVENHTPTYFDAEELTDIAEYYASIGKEQDAEAVIDFGLHLHPTNTDILVFKSRSLCIKGRLNEAYKVMNLIEDPTDREVRFLKADLLVEEKRMEEADAIYKELAESEEESLEVLLDIFLNYMDVHQKEYAKKWLDKIREKGFNENNSQKFRDAWCDYCMTFGYPEKAVKAFQISLDELPYSINHWNGLAKCYLAQMNTEQALEAVDFSLAIEEDNLEAKEIKAYCFTQNGNQEEAITLCKQVLPITKNPTHIYALLVKCYLDLEKAHPAKETCREWLNQCPNMTAFEKSEVYSYIALCCFNLYESLEGMKYIDAALDLEPAFRGAILQKGMLHLQLQENNEAEKMFQKVIDISPDDELSEIYYNIANSYFFLMMFRPTIEWCDKIIQSYPNEQMEALHLKACCQYYLNEIDECMKTLTTVWKLNHNHLDEEYLNDNRFKPMFSDIIDLLRKRKQTE